MRMGQRFQDTRKTAERFNTENRIQAKQSDDAYDRQLYHTCAEQSAHVEGHNRGDSKYLLAHNLE